MVDGWGRVWQGRVFAKALRPLSSPVRMFVPIFPCRHLCQSAWTSRANPEKLHKNFFSPHWKWKRDSLSLSSSPSSPHSKPSLRGSLKISAHIQWFFGWKGCRTAGTATIFQRDFVDRRNLAAYVIPSSWRRSTDAARPITALQWSCGRLASSQVQGPTRKNVNLSKDVVFLQGCKQNQLLFESSV